jgi:pimeloyl-ACP methyl ester carboxylesterase
METEHRLTLADGRTLACLELGDPAGPPVIYLHGYPGSRLEARLTAYTAERLPVRLLAPDRPGFGASTFQRGRTLGAWGADMQCLADKFALKRFAVIGVSGGGPYALAAAAQMPDRVSRVALVGAVGLATRRDLVAGMVATHRLSLAAGAHLPRLARLAIALAAQVVRRYPERFLAHMVARTSPPDREVLADPNYCKLMLDSTIEALRQGGFSIAHELTLLARPWDIRLEEIRTPVTIWQGLADNIVPAAMARYLADELAHSELHCLPNEGHLSVIVHHADRVFADLMRK